MPGEPPPTCDDSTPEEQVAADDLIHAAKAMGADKNVNLHFQLERPTRRLSRVFGTVKGRRAADRGAGDGAHG